MNTTPNPTTIMNETTPKCSTGECFTRYKLIREKNPGTKAIQPHAR
jgi:hypothetical protein